MSADDAARTRFIRSDILMFGTLAVAGVCATLALQPYRRAIAAGSAQVPDTTVGLFTEVPLNAGVGLVVAAAAIGIVLRRDAALGISQLSHLLRGAGDWQRRRWVIRTSIAVGAIVGSVIVLADLAVRPFVPAYDMPQVALLHRYLAGFHGAISEEIVVRLGLLTTLIWLALRLGGRRSVSKSLSWMAIGAAALVSGMLHLPGGADIANLTPVFITRTVLSHGFGGAVFGWLYLRRGLTAAMIAHFCAHVVIHTGAWMLS